MNLVVVKEKRFNLEMEWLSCELC